jgi:hypothetical protein
MSNSYYNHTTYPTPNSPGSSAQLRAELELVTAGFDLLPTLTGNGYKVAMINSAGDALIASSSLQSLVITSSTINSTTIGGTSAAAGTFTNLTATGTVSLGSSIVVAGGTINNTVIGNTTPAAGSFTTLSSSGGISGTLTGNVTGNLTGNVTGNVTGNLTGNVTSTGTSTFSNVTISGTLNMDGGSAATIENLSTPVNSGDAANKGYVDTQDALRLALAGGTMSGAIAMGTNKITGLGDPTLAQDAATKTYVDTGLALKLNLAGGTMSGAIAMGTNKITGLGNPTNDQDAATKIYVDGAVQGVDAKASVRAATTANITLANTQTIDGIALVAGERVLVKDQTAQADNGIYIVVSGGSWTRSTDADTYAELVHAFVFVEAGTVNASNGYVCSIPHTGTLGVTAITWVQFSGAGQISAGTGMTKTGNTLNVNTASSSRIVAGADELDLATTGVTAGTYTSITVDQWGRATGGTNPTTLSGYGITNAYTKTEVDNALALKLNLSGGTMSGAIAMGTNKITGLGDPTLAQDAATKTYVDTADALKLSLSGGTMTGAIAMGGFKITGLGDPTANQDAVTLLYLTTLYGSTASAAASASAASISASNASTSESNASAYAGAALASANNAAASYDAFDDRYLGAKASDPTLDNDGNALLTGALYWNTTLSQMRVYDGAAWIAAYLPASGYLQLAGGTMTGTITFAAGQTIAGYLATTGGTMTGDLTLNAQSDLRFADSDSSNYVGFQSPAAVASNVLWTLPNVDGTSGQALVTDGSGTLSWASAGGVTTGKAIAMAMVFGF